MELYQAIMERRSVRQYTADRVPRALVMRVLEAASWAPSGRNQQPWRFYVLQGDRITAIGAALGAELEAELPPGTPPDERTSNRIIFHRTFGGAPLLIVATMPRDERTKVHAQGLGAAVQNLCLAAHAEGLGTCWMVQPLRVEAVVRAAAGIPYTEELFAVTPLGYPRIAPPAVPRRDPSFNNMVVWVE